MYTTLLLSASVKSVQSLRMWPIASHHVHCWSVGGLRSCACPPLSLWACAIKRSRTIFVSSSRATPRDDPLTTSVGTALDSIHLCVSSIRAGVGSSDFLPVVAHTVIRFLSLQSCYLSKRLQTPLTMAQPAVSPSSFSSSGPTLSQSNTFTDLTKSRT